MASIEGYCTVEDVEDVLQEASLDGALGANNNLIVQKAIGAQTEWVEKSTDRHWYVSGGVSPDKEGIVFTDVQSRDDEHSLPTHGGYVAGAYGSDPNRATSTTGTVFSSEPKTTKPKQEIRLATGDIDDDTVPAYTRIPLARKDADAVNSLHIANADGGYDDWVASNDYSGGVGFDQHAGDDFYVRINSGGAASLNIDVHSLDDDLFTLSNAIVIDYDFGTDGLPQSVRQGVAKLAASWLADNEEFRSAIPNDGQLVDVETKADRWERQGRQQLQPHIEEPYALPREQQA